ncbi:ATP-binding protein [Actinomadura darangshiensis]|uniref:ATP-binding protein n=1 Tax=Actinomadura darangshiensis TaxID=705336 RepID=A0A4R5AI69_9ACTN|nr:ATP-binding protein [Actinomadura darangshiensis]TDD69802.1 ATP-binding protein [Actinomadura darangshiensis]
MLLSFRASNHRSLRSEQQLLLTPVYASGRPEDVPWEALTVAGIFGANASGKSNLLDAFQYMAYMVRWSFRENEPGRGIERHPFALDDEMPAEVSTFVVDVDIDGVRHTYGFALDDVQIVEEWMYSYPLKKRRVIFHRRGDVFDYGEHSPKGLRQAEPLTEPNVLFLSVAARSRQQVLRPVYDWFQKIGWRTSNKANALPPPGLASEDTIRLTSLLRAADTGIVDTVMLDESDDEYAARVSMVWGGEGRPPPRRKRLHFQHRGADGNVTLSLSEQSTGTRSLYRLGRSAFRSLDLGSPFVVDELDSSLHPFLAAQLIRLFRDPHVNARGAQLIFTSHDASLLGRMRGEEVLLRDHIWFTEKDECGATALFPVSEFKPRSEENRERRYLAGRYGAVPLIDDGLFAAALAAREDSGDVSEEP